MAKRLIEKMAVAAPLKAKAEALLPDKATWLSSGKVVEVGPGQRDKDGNLMPIFFQQGDVVHVPENGGKVPLDYKEYQKQVLSARIQEGLTKRIVKEESTLDCLLKGSLMIKGHYLTRVPVKKRQPAINLNLMDSHSSFSGFSHSWTHQEYHHGKKDDRKMVGAVKRRNRRDKLNCS